MESAVRTMLLAHAPLAALVGDRIDWGVRAQGRALPAVTLQIVSRLPGMTYAGADGWEQSRIQIDAWGRTYLAAQQVADVLALPPAGLLAGYRGDLPGLRLRTMIAARRTDDDSDDAGPVHRASIDVIAWHRAI